MRLDGLLRASGKFIIIFCFFFFTLSVLFSEVWFVCLGSFTKEDNAKKFVKLLKDKGFDASIDTREINGTIYHRVLLLLDFEAVDEARAKRDMLLTDAGIIALKLKDLWVCVPSDEFYQEYQRDRVAHHLMERPIVLRKNEELPISKAKPYFVSVGKYKQESVAQKNKERLKKEGFDAYVVKSYDDAEYFSFDVNVSALKTQQEAEELVRQLQERGINTKGVVSYDDVKDAIGKYNDIVNRKKVGKFLGNTDIPTVFSHQVSESIKEFPINKDFQIESIYIFDLENIRKSPNNSVEVGRVERMLMSKDETSVASLAYYKDNLFNKNISILLQKGKNGAYKIEDKEGTTSLTLRTALQKLNCTLTNDEMGLHLTGVNEEGDTLVKMESDSFSREELDVFLNNISNDSSLLIYPEIRKSLLVLPKENEECKRDFLSFELEKVPPSYAKERNYAKWAMPVVGHWRSRGFFNVKNEMVSVAFFDMDYDYNARSIHKMFMETHKQSGITDSNKPIALKKLNGWFNILRVGNEVSFSCKSYIIAVNSYNNYFDTAELVRLSDDLQIWE